MGRILAISSHVVRGTVGLGATVPALTLLGHETWALPTVVMASRPGLGQATARRETPATELSDMLSALEADACWPMLDAVVTGYFVSAAAVRAVAQALQRIKSANPRALVLVDPVLGDAGRLYVAAETAEAIRSELIPLAGIATPNAFELGWLCGATPAGSDQLIVAARQLGPGTVVVTSARETPAGIPTLLVTSNGATERIAPRRAGVPNGAGDLFDGLFLGHLVSGTSAEPALDASLASLDRVLARSTGRDVLQLSALKA
jgi:pyridoxine kinase